MLRIVSGNALLIFFEWNDKLSEFTAQFHIHKDKDRLKIVLEEIHVL
mgnify:CR=1